MIPAVFVLVFAQGITAPPEKHSSDLEQLQENEKQIVQTLAQRGYDVRVKDGKVREVTCPSFSGSYRIGDLELITAISTLEELSMPASARDADLVRLRNLKELTHLDLTTCENITGSGLVHLRHTRKLTKITLQYSGMTDAAMRHLAGCTRLRKLDIYYTRVTDAGLAHLEGLSQLRELRIGEMNITGSGFRHLRNLAHLKKLDLSYSFVDDAGLRELNGLKNLRELSLYASDVTDSGLAHLSNHPKLRVLRLGQMLISDAGIMHVAQLKNLKELDLDCANDSNLKLLGSLNLRRLRIYGGTFTDKSVATLLEMKSLKELVIHGSGISLQGLLKLEKALPRRALESDSLSWHGSMHGTSQQFTP